MDAINICRQTLIHQVKGHHLYSKIKGPC